MLSKFKSFFGNMEGSVRPKFGVSEFDNVFQIQNLEDGWQRNLRTNMTGAKNVPAVRACVDRFAGAASQCKPEHVKIDSNGKKTVATDSPQARLLRKPNQYETWNQFLFNCVCEMFYQGECFCYVIRDNRQVITAIHRLSRKTCTPYVSEGEVFYSVGTNPLILDGIEAMIPARDILHLRSFTPRHPLIGESPLTAAALAIGINVTLSESQGIFFSQMSRPSGILSSDQILTKDQMRILREAWNEQSSGLSQGRVPIMAGGFKFQSMGITSQDSQLIDAQKMSTADIARVFGVPLPLIGDLEHSTMSNVSELVNLWLATGLGSLLENLEASFNKLFGFGKNDTIKLDESALLRMNFKDRMEGLAKGIQGGVLTINEARGREGLQNVTGGNSNFMQSQMTPIEILSKPPEPPPAPVIQQVPEKPPEMSADDKKILYFNKLKGVING